MKTIIGFSVAIIILVFVLFFSNDLNRASIFGSQGNVENGEKFGVIVGDNYAKSIKTLEARGLRRIRIETGGQCAMSDYRPDLRVHVLSDDSWRKGVVCLAEKDRAVVAIGWYYNVLAP